MNKIDQLKERYGYSGKPKQWQQCFDLMVKELLPPNEWVNVSERLPPKNTKVIVARNILDNNLWSYTTGWVDHRGDWTVAEKIFIPLFWMPLPPPPEASHE